MTIGDFLEVFSNKDTKITIRNCPGLLYSGTIGTLKDICENDLVADLGRKTILGLSIENDVVKNIKNEVLVTSIVSLYVAS